MENREQRERKRKVVEIVSGFLSAVVRFEEIHNTFWKRELAFEDVESFIDDRGKSVLFQLKENCHALFRRNVSAGMEKELLFDLTVGTIFHEAMKLRENLYQLQFYGPQSEALEAKKDRTRYEEDFRRQLAKILHRAENRFEEGMEETRTLISEATQQLKSLLPDFNTNGLLMRFFVEQPELIKKVFGGAVADPLELMHPGRKPESLALAGRSYLESARYAKAQECFRLSLDEGCEDPELPSLLTIARGMSLYYAGEQEEAIAAFEEVASLGGQSEEVKIRLPEIGRAARRLASDLRTQRKIAAAERASALAEWAEEADN